MLPEYDFSGKKGVRGKHSLAMQKGYTVQIENEDGTVTAQRFGPPFNWTMKKDCRITRRQQITGGKIFHT